MIPTPRSCVAWIACAGCALTLLAATRAGAQTYTLTDLQPVFGEAWGSGIDLNNRGQVLTINALWTPGEGTTPLPFSASSLNDVGQVVGSWGTQQQRAVRWSAAIGPQDVGPGYVSDINNRGDMVGSTFSVAADNFRAWRQPAGAAREALRLSDTETATSQAINENGAAVGFHPSGPHLEYWPPGQTTAERLDTSSTQTYAYDINSVGQITGQGEDYTAYLYNPGQGLLSLGELKDRSTRRGLNDQGHVVGDATDDIDSDRGLAFVWTPELGMRDLNELVDGSAAGWTLNEAWAINNAGQIVGFGQHGGELTRAPFLLTPVPEPGTAVTHLLAAAALLSRRRRVRPA